MKKSKEFNNVLDECLERLLVKGETLEQCLRSYPEQADVLEPLLQTALATKQAAAIQPRAEFKARARYQFRSALQEVKPKRRLFFLGWQPRWATAVAIILVLVLAGSGTVVAAGNSMPDNPLYPVKLATEQVRLTLTPSALGKAELYAKLADKRVAEIIYMADKGDARQIEVITQRLDKHLAMLTSLAIAQREEERALKGPPALEPLPPPTEKHTYPYAEVVIPDIVEVDRMAELRILLESYAVNHPARLQEALETAPEAVKPVLLKAIATLKAGYEKALDALD
ncbi:DUF5667 domain-containing protein [Dehalococcoidales bacterium]|nr:DUF5667 domain-containing protein [Dehalococcoidales bacterium]